MQLLNKCLQTDARHHKQEFIPAITHQAVRLTDTAYNRRRHRHQHFIARHMPIYIIVGLKIIQIEHRDTGIHPLLF